jgi:hypothetical protein
MRKRGPAVVIVVDVEAAAAQTSVGVVDVTSKRAIMAGGSVRGFAVGLTHLEVGHDGRRNIGRDKIVVGRKIH